MPREWLGEPEKTVPPFGFEFVWEVFVDLSAARRSSGFGPTALAWSDVDAYCRLTRTRMTLWELGLVMRVDRRWMQVVSEHLKERQAAEDAKRHGPKGG